MNRIRKFLAGKPGKKEEDGLWVTGSGLVYIPPGRLNEISKVVAEHHAQEAERAKILASVRRV
ncbi:MAG: hypothetical protein LYZ70_02680 [Nitrososphaerales archaeon]|nr:hypothetical protein [Nitrososphaerales archaeon]